MNQALTTTRSASTGDRHIAFIQSCWHRDIVDQSRVAFRDHIGEASSGRFHVDYFEVPGALELPLQVKLLAKTGEYAAIAAAGLIVDGGIYRHEFVASTVLDALMQIQLEYEVPVISLVLTPQRFHEHEDHREFFLVKWAEAAMGCLGAIDGLSALRAASAGSSGTASPLSGS